MELTPKQQAMLVHMQSFMKRSELYALKWIAAATTGAAGRREVYRGPISDNVRISPEELTDQALGTAVVHIENIDKVARNIALLLEGREDEIGSY